MKRLMLLMVMALVTGGCCTVTRSPGHVVESGYNFQSGVKKYERGHVMQAIPESEKAIGKNTTNFDT